MRAAGINTLKAGLSGLFLSLMLFISIIAASAQPLLLEVEKAEAAFDQRTNQPVITIRMSKASAKLFADLTEKNVGRSLEFRLDGRAIMRPIIREPVMGGTVQISGNLTVDQTKSLATRLSAGTSKIEVEVVGN